MRALGLALLVACKGGSAPPPTTGSGSAPAPAGSGSAVGASIAAAMTADGGAALPERCTEACRYLTDTSLADAPARFARECNRPWPYADSDCDAPLHQVNCIYAAHGYTFKRPEWKAKFEHAAWYHPRADFKESELTALENASIRELKQKDKACHAPPEPVTDADRALVEQAFVGLDSGEDDLFRNLRVDDKTKMHYSAKDANGRTITVEGLYHAVGGGEHVDRAIDLVFEGDKLVDAHNAQ